MMGNERRTDKTATYEMTTPETYETGLMLGYQETRNATITAATIQGK